MSITTGTLPAIGSWTERCDQIKTLFESIPGVTVYSDTGTGTSRILVYALPGLGENHLLKFRFSTIFYTDLLKLDKTTNLLNLGSCASFPEWPYTLVLNGNLLALHLLLNSSSTLDLLWTKCGDDYKTFANGSYISANVDGSYGNVGSTYAFYADKRTTSDKIVFMPAFAPGNTMNQDMSDVPMENVSCWSNLITINPYTCLTVDSTTYMVWYFGYSPSYHLINCG